MKFYPHYKKSDIATFKAELSTVLGVSKIEDCSSLPETFTSVLHKHVSINKKILRYNNVI